MELTRSDQKNNKTFKHKKNQCVHLLEKKYKYTKINKKIFTNYKDLSNL